MTTDSDPASTQSFGGTTTVAPFCPLVEEALRILSNLKEESARFKTQLNLLEEEISKKRAKAHQFDTLVVMGEHLEWLEEENMDLKEDMKRLQSKLARFESSEQADENAPMNRPPLRQLDFGQGSSRIG